MKVYYIFDSYCGWCYGFETILKPFIEAHPEVEVTVLSGGLFMDGHSLSAFPYMSDTNKRIADMFGVEFGKPYLNLLETESMVPDSNDAAIGFGVLRSRKRLEIIDYKIVSVGKVLKAKDVEKLL